MRLVGAMAMSGAVHVVLMTMVVPHVSGLVRRDMTLTLSATDEARPALAPSAVALSMPPSWTPPHSQPDAAELPEEADASPGPTSAPPHTAEQPQEAAHTEPTPSAAAERPAASRRPRRRRAAPAPAPAQTQKAAPSTETDDHGPRPVRAEDDATEGGRESVGDEAPAAEAHDTGDEMAREAGAHGALQTGSGEATGDTSLAAPAGGGREGALGDGTVLTTGVDAAGARYGRVVRRALADLVRYPHRARRARLEGEVVVIVVVDTSGRVLDARLETSSGHDLLDRAVLEALADLHTLPAPPRAMGPGRHTLRVPYHFSP